MKNFPKSSNSHNFFKSISTACQNQKPHFFLKNTGGIFIPFPPNKMFFKNALLSVKNFSVRYLEIFKLTTAPCQMKSAPVSYGPNQNHHIISKSTRNIGILFSPHKMVFKGAVLYMKNLSMWYLKIFELRTGRCQMKFLMVYVWSKLKIAVFSKPVGVFSFWFHQKNCFSKAKCC